RIVWKLLALKLIYKKPLKGLPPITFPTRVSEKFKEKLRALKDIQGQTTLLIKSSSLPKLPNDKNNSTNYFDDNSRKLGTENNFNMRSASFNGSHLSTNYADTYFSPETRLMINELEKHGEELAKAQDQINMFLPRDVINKLKKDKSSLNKQKIAEEDEEFESDATSDYSDDEEEDVQGKVLKEPDSMLLNDQNKIVDDDPEKAWKDFDWNSNIDVTTMKSQSLRNSYRASGSFIRNSYHTTFKNASLQQLSRSNCKNINIQQWKKEHQVNYNSRKIYNSSIGNKSDSSISGTNGILIKQVNHVRKDYFEPGIEEFKQQSEEHASSSSREGSVDSL
ncbi:4653_t:CDS:2, partial [Funneliformis caledonium]